MDILKARIIGTQMSVQGRGRNEVASYISSIGGSKFAVKAALEGFDEQEIIG